MDQQQKLALLLQPALIRLIDQLRLQLSTSTWQWKYETFEVWPSEVPQAQRNRYAQLQEQLDTAPEQDIEAIEAELAMMIFPIPVYQLDLWRDEAHQRVNMWELCYQICLCQYEPVFEAESLTSPSLEQFPFDSKLLSEVAEIDWVYLDHRAEEVVSRLLETLN